MMTRAGLDVGTDLVILGTVGSDEKDGNIVGEATTVLVVCNPARRRIKW
jgi:hypothetical protein